MMRILVSLILGSLFMFAGAQAVDGVQVVKDLLKEWGSARIENQLGQSRVTKIASSGFTREAVMLHPTAKPARASFTLTLPPVANTEKLVLVGWCGVDDKAPRDDKEHPHNGVRFLVELEGETVADVDRSEPGWLPLSVDLTPYGGKQVTLTLITDGKGDTNYDWAYFAEPQILRLRKPLIQAGTMLPPEGVLEIVGKPGERWTLQAVGTDFPPIILQIPAAGSGQQAAAEAAGSRQFWLRYAFPGARAAELHGTPKPQSVQVFGFSPRLRIKQVQSARALLQPGETTEVVVSLQNMGQGTWLGTDLQLDLIAQRDARIVKSITLDQNLIPPGEDKTYRFQVRVGNDPLVLARLLSSAGSDAALLRLPVAPLPKGVPDPGRIAKTFNSHAVLQNEQVRLFLTRSNNGAVARLYVRYAENWQLLAVSSPIAEGILTGAGGIPRTHAFKWNEVKVDEKSLRLILEGTLGPVGQVSVEFRLNGQGLESVARFNALQNADIYAFRFPDWRVGDGAFGTAKSEALLPGLEYLMGQEPSSDQAFSAPPFDLRFAPHPYKITIPLMAVRMGRLLFVLGWDPLQMWSGVLRYPSVLFASPNFLNNGAHHRLALWLPSIPRWADENSLQAREPFRLLGGQTMQIRAQVYTRTNAQTVLEAVEWYLAQNGVPRPPTPERNNERAMERTLSGLLRAWDADKKAWRHTNTGPVFYDPAVALPLWVLAHRLPETDPRRTQALDQVRTAAQAVAKSGIGWEVAFYVGGLPSVLQGWQAENRQRMRQQRADGSWAWQPPSERHRVFGKAGDTSSGHSGREAAILWRYALLTLDAEAIQAAHKASRFLDTQTRPEGAQTWELPLHVPDILAASYCVNAYLDAYQLTGESRFLQRARYWALSGLPFVYLWSAQDRSIMRGATIPVFGVTWLNVQPWFGVAVQWCGLVYARSLFRLAEYDRSIDWRTLAEGITLCGVQQQELITNRYPEDEGMYPDAYSPVKGDEEYHWDLNPRLIAPNLSLLLGLELEPRTLLVQAGERQVSVTAPGLKAVRWEEGKLLIELSTAVRLPALHVLIGGLNAPEEMLINNQPLEKVEDIDQFLWEISTPKSGGGYYTQAGGSGQGAAERQGDKETRGQGEYSPLTTHHSPSSERRTVGSLIVRLIDPGLSAMLSVREGSGK